MRKLTFKEPAGYFLNAQKKFNSSSKINDRNRLLAFVFAYQMCFGAGHHRSTRTGGQTSRTGGEKFGNTFQGKLAEIILHDCFTSHNISCSDIDFRVMGESEWDDTDFIINGKHISVKSAAFFSNLLLLEKNDWDAEGRYIPNITSGNTYLYDYFVLVRIKPDIKSLLKQNKLFYSDSIDKEKLFGLIEKEDWRYDIPGFISRQDLVEKVIAPNHVIPQNALLNGTTKMDASNYYVQTGDLSQFCDIIELLK